MLSRTHIAMSAALAVALVSGGHAARADVHCERGVARVLVDGKLAWCAKTNREQIISSVVSSELANAVAFATLIPGQGIRLIVVLLQEGAEAHMMTWQMPHRRFSGGDAEPTVTWLGTSRVAFGYSPVRPEIVASWRVRER